MKPLKASLPHVICLKIQSQIRLKSIMRHCYHDYSEGFDCFYDLGVQDGGGLPAV